MKSPHKIATLVVALGAALGAHAQSCGAGGGTTVCLSAAAASTGAQLAWTVQGALSGGLQIYRNTSSNPTGRERIAQLSNGDRSYADTTAATGSRYW